MKDLGHFPKENGMGRKTAYGIKKQSGNCFTGHPVLLTRKLVKISLLSVKQKESVFVPDLQNVKCES